MSDITTNVTNRKATAEQTVASQTGVKLTPQGSSPISGSDSGIYVDTATGELFYRDASGNLTQVTDDGSVNGGGGGGGNGGIASGGYQASFTFAPTGTDNFTSASFTDITGVIDQTLTTSIGGQHTFVLYTTGAYSTNGGSHIEYAVRIDGTDYALGPRSIINDGNRLEHTAFGLVTLAAGTHTVRVRARRAFTDGDSFPSTDTSCFFTLSASAQGAGINGVNEYEDTLASDFSITATSFTDTGLEVTFTTLEGEPVLLNFFGNLVTAGGTASTSYVAYQVDAGTDILQTVISSNEFPGYSKNASFSTFITGLAAGQHTVKIRVKRDVANWTLNGTTAGGIAKLSITKFAIGGVGAGMTSTSSGQLTVAKSVTSSFPTYEDSGLSCTFTTQIPNETIMLHYVGGAYKDSNSPGGYYHAYKLDSDTDVQVHALSSFQSTSSSLKNFNMSFSIPVLVPTIGSHTLKYRVARDGGGTWTIPADDTLDTNASRVELFVTQFRGGIIPIKNNDNTIVQHPTALNFVGADVTNSNGEALVTFPNASLGGYTNRLDYTPTGSFSTTSATFVDITGMVNQTFTTPVSGPHVLQLVGRGVASSGGTGAEHIYGFNIDGVDYEIASLIVSLSVREAFCIPLVLSLSAGAHTIRPRVRRGTGTGSVVLDNPNSWLNILIEGQGSGINGLEVQEATQSADVTVSSTYPTYTTFSGLTLTTQTLENERVQISMIGSIQITGTTGDFYLGYKIDSGSVIEVHSAFISPSGAGNEIPISFSVMTAPLTAGSHTIEFVGTRAGTSSATLLGDSNVRRGCRSQVTRFKSIGIGAGTIMTESINGSDTDRSSAGFTQVNSVQCVISTASANEVVDISYRGNVQFLLTTNVSGQLGYSLDGGTTVVGWYQDREVSSGGASGAVYPGNFTIRATIPTAGSHTIRLMARESFGGTMRVLGSGTFNPAVFQVIQHRGGLIPVKDNAITIVDKPSALNFVGALVQADGTEAKVTFPNAALGGLLTHLNYSPTGTATTTSTSFGDITGMVNQTITTPVSGNHLFILRAQGYRTTGTATQLDIAVNVDGTDYDMQGLPIDETGERHYLSGSAVVALSAGAHTVKPRWRSGNGAQMNTADGWAIDVIAQGTGINGMEVSESQVTGDLTISTSYPTFTATGHSVTVNTLENERLELKYTGSILGSGAAMNAVFGYRVDGGTTVSLFQQNTSSATRDHICFSTITSELTAGQHTIELMATRGTAVNYVISGSAGGIGISNKFQVTRIKAMGIGAGTIVTSDTIPSDVTINSAHPTYMDTGYEVTIQTIANESVLLAFNGEAFLTAVGGTSIALSYKVDSGSDVPVLVQASQAFGASGPDENLSFSIPITISTAGSHTIKLRAARFTNDWKLRAPSTYAGGNFSVIQYRGGLIPVKDSGVEIVPKPSALNFVGALVEANGTEARVTFPNAALGGYVNKLDFTPSATTTSATFADIAGAGNQTFVTPVSGDHVFSFAPKIWASGGPQATIAIQLVIDDVTTLDLGSKECDGDGQVGTFVGYNKISLAAGSHTVKPQWRRVSGTGTANIGFTAPLLIQAQGSGINGLEVAESLLSGDVSVTTVSPSYQATGLTVTINTLENERVQISYTGTGLAGGTDSALVTGYRIDSGTVVPVNIQHGTVSGDNFGIDFTIMSAALTAGQHTIELMVAKGGGASWTLKAPVANAYTSRLQVTRFKSNGIGAGTITATESLGSNFTVTSVNPTFQDTGLDLTFNTIASEDVELILYATGSATTTGHSIWVAYQLDGGSDVVGTIVTGTSGYNSNLSFSALLRNLSAGSHTVKIRASRDSSNWNFGGTGAGQQPTLQIVQHRGGIIPIKDSGVSVVDKPSALNFVNAIVEANGTEARVTFPNATLGGYLNNNTFTATSTQSTSSSTYSDITGMTDYTFVTPVSGPHLFTLFSQMWSSGLDTDPQIQLLIDGSVTAEFKQREVPDEGISAQTQQVIVNLTAGSHTVRPQWKRVTGSAAVNARDTWPWNLTIQAQGSGINGLEFQEFNLVSNFSVTANYINTPGANMAQVDSVQLSVNALEGERVQVIFTGDADSSLADEFVMGYQVDSSTPVVAYYSQITGVDFPGITWSVFTEPLTAGLHTIKLMACKGSGDTMVIQAHGNIVVSRFQVVRHKSFGIGAGTIKTEDTFVANKTLSSVFPTYEDTGLDVTIQTIANEEVTLQFTCSAQLASGSGGSMYLAYKLDSAADVPIFYEGAVSGLTEGGNISGTVTIPIATAGSHTIKLRGAVDSGRTWTMHGSTTGAVTPKLQAIQYRGGLIPIQNNGTSIVDKPDALDFNLDFTVTNPSGLKALIDVKYLDMSVSNTVKPSSNNTIDLGADATRFKDIYYAGTLYGGASSMKYKSKETDGATAIAHEFDTNNTLVNASAKLLSFKNAGVEKSIIDKSGYLRSLNLLHVESTTDFANTGSYQVARLELTNDPYWMVEAFDNVTNADVFIDGSANGATSGISMTVDGGTGNEAASFKLNNFASGNYGGAGGKDLAFAIDAPQVGTWIGFIGLSDDGWFSGGAGTTVTDPKEWDFLSQARDASDANAYWFDTQFALTSPTAKLVVVANNLAEKFSIGINGGINVRRTATAVSANSAGEVIIGVTSTASPRTITLDSSDVVSGRIVIVKDESGGAATNNITVDTEGSETIDGAASIPITANYGVLRFYSDGTNWFTF